MSDERAALDPGAVAFDDRGLVPAIAQDAGTGAVLMLAYMDREALDATLRTGEVHFHSRSRGRLWKKGETSGNVLHLVDLALDCDADALLLKVHPAGPACHTGEATCFGPLEPDLGRFLTDLAATLVQRKRDLPAGSYSAELFRAGPDGIAQKLVEEASETAAALRGEGRERTISELTDLLYVMLVAGAEVGATAPEIRSSLEEKRRAAPARRAQREARRAASPSRPDASPPSHARASGRSTPRACRRASRLRYRARASRRPSWRPRRGRRFSRA
jgi:phosphoribosyl-ATP pyrophosphohydrolase/phosphoribosyl-AMP cyclohydrolase